MTHGGKRKGAGRKKGTGKFGEPTVLMRIPKSLVKVVKKLLKEVVINMEGEGK